MSRLRFRAWYGKRMFYDIYIEGKTGRCVNYLHQWWQAREKLSINEPIIMQSTGLKDKNGDEIFERDVLNFGIVTWLSDGYDSESVGWHLKDYGNNYTKSNNYHSFYAYWPPLEIIGNIYENPELLNNGEMPCQS